MVEKKIEVFQDMAIRGSITKRSELRAALIAAAVKLWQADLERSAEMARETVMSKDVILFRREAGEDHPAAGLTLWETVDGYNVSNIFPSEVGQLTYAQYNAILTDFVERIAAPATDEFGFTIARTEPWQSLENWLSPDTALKLRHFSSAANKSTGSSHPADERRWFEFLIAAHRDRNKLGAACPLAS